MPGYVRQALLKFKHILPTSPEHSPYSHTRPTYGAKVQYEEPSDSSDLLPPSELTIIQMIVGTFLYYGIALDNTLLVGLNDISQEQSKATSNTSKKTAKLLNYLATHPDAQIKYHASGMILHVHSDASYLSVNKARSRAGGVHFLSDLIPNPQDPDYVPIMNGILHVVCKILKNIMASAAEAELGALFINAREAVPIRTTLVEMKWPQPPTPIQVDNSTAVGIANQSIKQKMSKAMDMRFYWVIDRIKQGQFIVYWKPGTGNLGDYPTKHHCTEHHIKMRPVYLHEPTSQYNTLQGCVNCTINAVTVTASPAKRIRQHIEYCRNLCKAINHTVKAIRANSLSSYYPSLI